MCKVKIRKELAAQVENIERMIKGADSKEEFEVVDRIELEVSK